jgi:hypothetical protein
MPPTPFRSSGPLKDSGPLNRSLQYKSTQGVVNTARCDTALDGGKEGGNTTVVVI